MFLRDYLYVDLDKVRALISQILDGVPELSTRVERKEKDRELKNRYIGGVSTKNADEQSYENSLSDSLFRILEEELEPLGLLVDVSQELAASNDWGALEDTIYPGAILRISAPATLFHPGHLSNALVGIATAAHGLSTLGDVDAPPPAGPGGGKRKNQPRNRALPQKVAGGNPEDLLPSEAKIPVLDIPREELSGMIQLIRGLYDNGVHLTMKPCGSDGPVVSARLESGRRFLDASPEILFSRYGSGEQVWTAVGLVGQLGITAPDADPPRAVDDDGNISRASTMGLIDWFLSIAGTSGLIDQPVKPSFSFVPLAVYRSIGQPEVQPSLHA
ncbi:DUF6414 family protein [Williamsia sp. MIQD14]|uniref:DUF6414 family protein n=1 Tax=Williamsia sp. MIQD14 TaxID=3425703 RepID=UPI003DA08D25